MVKKFPESSDLQLRCANYSNQQGLSFELGKYYMNTETDGKLDQAQHSKLVETFYFKFCSVLKKDKKGETRKLLRSL